jgi:hypothetical protein
MLLNLLSDCVTFLGRFCRASETPDLDKIFGQLLLDLEDAEGLKAVRTHQRNRDCVQRAMRDVVRLIDGRTTLVTTKYDGSRSSLRADSAEVASRKHPRSSISEAVLNRQPSDVNDEIMDTDEEIVSAGHHTTRLGRYGPKRHRPKAEA